MEEPEGLFAKRTPRCRKVACTVCGRTGWDVPARRGTWKEPCIRGHAPCWKCGQQLSLLQNGRPRTHARCPA